jgi:sugar O-acyltransferase (sialic acid O-acetyltransferase NeuD family)
MVCLLIGAGGHAKAVAEAAVAALGSISVYVDPRPANWLTAVHVTADSEIKAIGMPVVIGVGGVTAAQLSKRLALLDAYLDRGHRAPAIVHPRAHVSSLARLDSGAIVLAGAVVQPGAVVGRGAIINTRAVVEHDSVIGDGAHVAPGAIVLGGCRVGRCAMIGAGAVVLPASTVADEALVPALTRHGTAA